MTNNNTPEAEEEQSILDVAVNQMRQDGSSSTTLDDGTRIELDENGNVESID